MKISSYSRQQGMASLFTAIVLLVCITLVVLFTSKTVVMDTKMTADNARTTQATAAAQAAMDHAVAYAIAGGIDQMNNSTGAATPDDSNDYRTPIYKDSSGNAPNPLQLPAADNCTIPASVNSVNYPAYLGRAAYPAHVQMFTSGSQSSIGMFYFVNTASYDHDNDASTAAIANPCNNAAGTAFDGNPMEKALVVAKGWSDDCTAVRTLSQCVGSFNTLNIDPATGGAGVPAPVVGVSSIGVKGNATLINRFTQSNIWAGDPSYTISGQTMGTYLRKTGSQVSDFSLAELTATIPTNGSLSGDGIVPGTTNTSVAGGRDLNQYTQLSSNNTTGNGVDVIVGDNSLAKVNFQTFFSQTLPDAIASAEAAGTCYSSSSTITPDPSQSPGTTTSPVTSPAQACTGGSTIPNPSTQGTVLVVDSSATGGLPEPLGSPDNPVILIVNGDFTWNGNGAIYGLVYATGNIVVGGSGTVVGSMISSDPNPPSGTGHGSPTIIYRPMGGDQVDNTGAQVGYDITNFARKGIISGSWRDW
jgi:hypothetical protein